MAANRKIPQRRCVGCGENKDKRTLIRIIKTPESEILMDTTGRQNGRGAYICKTADCLGRAVKNKGLERSLGMQIPESVYEELQEAMAKLGTG